MDEVPAKRNPRKVASPKTTYPEIGPIAQEVQPPKETTISLYRLRKKADQLLATINELSCLPYDILPVQNNGEQGPTLLLSSKTREEFQAQLMGVIQNSRNTIGRYRAIREIIQKQEDAIFIEYSGENRSITQLKNFLDQLNQEIKFYGEIFSNRSKIEGKVAEMNQKQEEKRKKLEEDGLMTVDGPEHSKAIHHFALCEDPLPLSVLQDLTKDNLTSISDIQDLILEKEVATSIIVLENLIL